MVRGTGVGRPASARDLLLIHHRDDTRGNLL
jgi:hypothetical protein